MRRHLGLDLRWDRARERVGEDPGHTKRETGAFHGLSRNGLAQATRGEYS
jgi:hypothetical protein